MERRRNGYALVELIVVISVNTVLMAVAVGLLGTLLRTEHQGRDHYERTGGLVRLADQFRSDVAVSREAIVVATAASDANTSTAKALRLQGQRDTSIEFVRDGERLRRIEYQGPTVVRREAYTLIDLTAAEFLVSDTHIVTIRLTFGEDANVSHHVLSIDARLNRDGRFAAEEEP